jgi:hypothetical protein
MEERREFAEYRANSEREASDRSDEVMHSSSNRSFLVPHMK